MLADPVSDCPAPDDDDPLAAALACPDAVLAIITGITGPSYRPLGAMMAFCGDRQVGSLSSGCIEKDLASHAAHCLQEGPGRSAMEKARHGSTYACPAAEDWRSP
ncbi:XdhC family protein [Paracoccus aerius]